MRSLIDTHALCWFIEGDEKLSELAVETIGDPDNTILISPAESWGMCADSAEHEITAPGAR